VGARWRLRRPAGRLSPMHTGRLVISAVWEPEIDCSGGSNDSTLALDTARTDRQLFEFETRTRLSARCCRRQRTSTSATGSDTRSVLSVARALDRRTTAVWITIRRRATWSPSVSTGCPHSPTPSTDARGTSASGPATGYRNRGPESGTTPSRVWSGNWICMNLRRFLP